MKTSKPKLLLLMFLMAGILFSYPAAAQQKPIPLSDALKKITKTFGTQFVYDAAQVKGKTTTANLENIKNRQLEDVLKEVLYNNELVFLYVKNNYYTIVPRDRLGNNSGATAPARPAPVQNGTTELQTGVGGTTVARSINGRITDSLGNGLAAATITAKGTRKTEYAITEETGIYSIKLPEGASQLLITAVGYQDQTLVLGSSSIVNSSLKLRPGSLAQVTVNGSTGYQSISKERATGAYDVVGQDIISKRPVSNISTALQGTVAGLQARENLDGSVNFLIRGTSSLYAGAQPLIVVDGFPITGSDFNNINPNDVENVTVLKDAAAASIWGARSANGVIVITTKKAAVGKALNVEFNAFTRMNEKIELDQILTQAKSPDHIRYERLAWENEWFFNQYAGTFQEIGKSLTLAQELLYANKLGRISTAQLNSGLDSLSGINNRGQIGDLLMRRAMLNQYNLTLSGATNRSRTYASLMFEDNKTGYIKSGYKRYNMNFNNQYRVANFLNLTFGANIQYRKQETSGATVGEIQGLSPYETLLDAKGNYSTNLTYNREQMGLLPLNLFPYNDWNYNLLREVRGRELTNEDLSARFQVGLNIRLFRGLTFDSKLQYEKRKQEFENYYSEDSYEARNTVNTFAKFNSVSRRVDTFYVPKGGILKSSKSDLESWLIRNQLSFNQNIGPKHEVAVIAGMEMSQYLTTTKTNPWAYGYFPDKLQSSFPQYGYGSTVDQFRNFLGTATNLSGGNTVFGWGMDRYVSYYGNASYTFNRKYSVSGSIRSDASNFITDDPALRWSPLWSVGAMWNAKSEEFLRNIKAINRLNVRVTHGKNGNVEKSTSPKTLLSLGTSISAATGTIVASISDNGNPFLRWEKTTTTNIGIDFELFKSKVFGKVDLYNKLGKDITGIVALPGATGTTSQKFNNAEILNRGIEVELGTQVKIPGTPVIYGSTVTYAYNKNRIQNLYYPALYAFDMIGGAFVEGAPINSVYSYTYLGNNANGYPSVAGPGKSYNPFNDVALHNRGLGKPILNFEGTGTPPHTLGWINNFSAYNFNLMVVFIGTFGGVYRNPVFNYATTVGGAKTQVDRFVADVFAGDPNLPGFAKPKDVQTYLWDRYAPNISYLVESSSYIQCKEINLDYTLPAKVVRKGGFSSAKVFVQARDLGLIWKANSKNYNPDWLPGSNRPVKSYTLGINFQL